MSKQCDRSGKSCSSEFIQVPKIQIYKGQYKRLKIYTNGYVTFGLAFKSRSPSRLNTRMLGYAKRKEAKRQGFAMLAPLWTDIDASSGEYFYHIYDLTKHVAIVYRASQSKGVTMRRSLLYICNN
ncbi:hypothetical protein NP493_1002g01069 [Ridgeia piscesae]|uniref:Uncharacterized protein n=1 Tax=Ridgeia piscesae TaxID=27915 RepID=A0AAD9NJ66_RIDPI|nr:hypothetical protein NP493_1002g01069 [Ridgeia piscesae]